MTAVPVDYTAHIDPWCIVDLMDGSRILFGFAAEHETLGGLSWVSSSQVLEIDEAAGWARTASGRRYRLGRRISQAAVPAEGDEAWLAFDLLVGGDAADTEAVPTFSADRPRDQRWVAACKVARHVGVAAPSRAPAEVERFLNRHLAAYWARRFPGRGS